MFYDAIRNDHGLPVDPFKAIVAPRPIAWISSLSPAGIANLAPYSFFNAVADDPNYIVIGSGGRKDSLANIEARREFAINLVSHELREAMNATSAGVGPEVDEFDLAGLAKASCRLIAAPRVAAAPAALECRLFQVVPLPDESGAVGNYLIVARVIGVHIDDRFIRDGRVDSTAMQLVARLGYSEYTTVREVWRMRRPD